MTGMIDKVCDDITEEGKRVAEKARPGMFPELAPPKKNSTTVGLGIAGEIRRRSSAFRTSGSLKVAPVAPGP